MTGHVYVALELVAGGWWTDRLTIISEMEKQFRLRLEMMMEPELLIPILIFIH